MVQFVAESGLLFGENWTTRDVRKWPTLFYQLHLKLYSNQLQSFFYVYYDLIIKEDEFFGNWDSKKRRYNK